jgi:hypothetical protein
MSRFIQQTEKKKDSKVERKVPLSQPGSKGYSQKTMEASKPIYTNQGKL